MIPIVKDIQPSKWEELTDIRFTFAVDPNTVSRFVKPVCQNIVTYDIETSNGHVVDGVAYPFDHDKYASEPEFYDNAEHQSLLYIWQCAIETNTAEGVKVFIGRTWKDFKDFHELLCKVVLAQFTLGMSVSIDMLDDVVNSSVAKTAPEMRVYIHNLPFEFQHLRNLFEDKFSKTNRGRSPVFARKPRKTMKASITVKRVRNVFCDTLVLTMKGLDKWCKDANLPTKKLEPPEGFYDKIRTPITPLTEFELQYAINDVVSMVYGIEQYRDKYGYLQSIPMTQTGEVRRTCKAKVSLKDKEWAKKQYDIMLHLNLDMYRVLVKTFCGGWTHANAYRTGFIWHDVRCFDFASSYPWVMCAFKFPVSPFEKVDPADFDIYNAEDPRSLDVKHHYIIRVKFRKLAQKLQNTYWSSSKTESTSTVGWEIDNGKISYADEVEMYMTNLDFNIMKLAYSWESFEIKELYVAEAGFLSKDLILTILDYYTKKTKLKGTGQDSLYNESKQFTNSIYGVSVTRTMSDEVGFGKHVDNEGNEGEGWYVTELNETIFYDKILEMREEDSFLSFPVGVFVTAFARSNLWTIISQVDSNTIYGDTDSAKGTFNDEDMKVINVYNQWVLERQEQVAKALGFPVDLYRPLKPSGKPDILGFFDEEDTCEEFKTLGAKRYMDIIRYPLDLFESIEEHGETWIGHSKKLGTCHIIDMDDKTARVMQATIAGLPKASAAMNTTHLDQFTSGRVFTTRETNKKRAIYNDNQTPALWIDEYGNQWHSEDRFGICIMPVTFDLSLSEEYEEFLAVLAGGEDDDLAIPEIFQ